VYRAVAGDVRGIAWSDLSPWRPALLPLALSTVLLLAVNVAHAFLWRRILGDLRVGWPTARSTLRIYFLSSLGRYLPGKLWHTAGLAALSARDEIPAAPAAACHMIGQLGFVTTGLLLLAAVLPEWGGGAPAIMAALILLAAGAGVWILIATPAGRRLRTWLAARVGGRVGPGLSATLDLADHIRPRDAALWFVGYGMSWVALGIAFSVFTAAFVPAAIYDTRHLAGTVAASYLAGLLLFTPAGIGVREVTMFGLLAQTAVIPAPAAALVAAISRLWFTAAELLPLILIPLAPGTRRGEVGDHGD